VLEKAGLIQRTQHGREHIIRANPVAAGQARDWIDYYAKFWQEHFEDVEACLQQMGDLK
jgi:hypothetical protein